MNFGCAFLCSMAIIFRPNPSLHYPGMMKASLVLLAVFILLSRLSARADIASGLVVHLPMNETRGVIAADASGNGTDAVLVQFPENHTQWVEGRLGGGLQFNPGLNDENWVVIIDSADPLNFAKPSAPAFSIALWVKGRLDRVAVPGLVAKGAGQGGEQFTIDVWNGTLRFFVRDEKGNAFEVNSGVALNNKWQHLACVFDSTAPASDRLKFYLDGNLVRTAPGPQTLQDVSAPVSIGSRESNDLSGYDLPFSGVIDDVRFYNRALSGRDVRELVDAAP